MFPAIRNAALAAITAVLVLGGAGEARKRYMFRKMILASAVSIVLASGAKAHIITYSVGLVVESFPDGSSFRLDGTNLGLHALNLTPGVAQFSLLDDEEIIEGLVPNTLNADIPVDTSMVINGSKPAITLTQAADFGSRDLPPGVSLALHSGPSEIFNFFDLYEITVTPVASTDVDGGRIASFLETPISIAVPEPSTLVLMGAGVLGLAALRNRKQVATAKTRGSKPGVRTICKSDFAGCATNGCMACRPAGCIIGG